MSVGQIVAWEDDGGSIANRGRCQNEFGARDTFARVIEQSAGVTETVLQSRCDKISAIVAIAEETSNERAYRRKRATLTADGGVERTTDEKAEQLD